MGGKNHSIYDERGFVYKSIKGYQSSDEVSEEYIYDPNGNLTVRKDGRGKLWSSTWDLFDRKTKDTMPAGNYAEYVLDKNGNTIEIKQYDDQDNVLARTKQHFDEMNRLWKVEQWFDRPDPVADVWLATEYELDANSRVIKVTNPDGNSQCFTYDGAGRRSGWEDDLGNEVSYGFNGDCCSATEIEEVEVVPGGGTETFRTEIVFDALNRVTERRVVNRDNSSEKLVFKKKYTSLSVAVEEEDAEGNKVFSEHDGRARVIKREVDLGGGNKSQTWYTYDQNGNLTKLKDDSGNETTWAFNARNLPTTVTYADSNYRSFTYNDDDSLSGSTDENGTSVTNTYNDNGWLTARSINRGTNVLGPTSESYDYDGMGRLIEASNSNSTVQFNHDSLSRLTSEVQGPNPLGQNGKTITNTYNDDGSRAATGYFSGYDLTYTVDVAGRWTKIEDASSNDLVTWSYFGPARRTEQAGYFNGTTENLSWDGFRRVSDVDHQDSQSTLFAGFDYAYDKMGNPLYEERTHQGGRGDVYGYDKANRLSSALIRSINPSAEIADGDWLDYRYQKKIDFNLDDESNRASVVETPYGQQGTSTSYTSNSVNWYTVIGGTNQTHDANGNLTFDGVYDYYYDYRNNLVSVEDSGNVVAEYEYDALNRRTEKTVGGAVTKFFYDGEHCVEEYDGSDNLLRKFVYGQRLDEIRIMIAPDIADVDGDQNTTELMDFYYHHNMLGSVTHITGPNEAVVEQYEYSPYGKTTIKDGQGTNLNGQSAIGNPYMYTARRYDEETGLYHYRWRSFDPERGRFLQRDPLALMLHMPNPYTYAESSPARYTDPMGLLVIGTVVDVSAGYILRVGAALGFVVDDQGNCAVIRVGSLGAGFVFGGGGAWTGYVSSADTVGDLRGFGGAIDVAVGPLSVGVQVSTAGDVSANGGGGIGTVDVSASATHTWVEEVDCGSDPVFKELLRSHPLYGVNLDSSTAEENGTDHQGKACKGDKITGRWSAKSKSPPDPDYPVSAEFVECGWRCVNNKYTHYHCWRARYRCRTIGFGLDLGSFVATTPEEIQDQEYCD